ncbi:MAG TPA: FGGY family carbohydrate kinase, partial [Iamia sp.]|nr:FGGY family carbohydrate kinase [Iamia sp.]
MSVSGDVSGSGDVTVGIDIGTTSVKAVAADADGTVLARARLPHDVRTPVPGAFEHDVDHAWRANVLGALDAVARGRPVAGVAVSAMVPSLGVVHADGTAAGPGLLYGDHRGVRA